jgi:hypothetical protein
MVAWLNKYLVRMYKKYCDEQLPKIFIENEVVIVRFRIVHLAGGQFLNAPNYSIKN